MLVCHSLFLSRKHRVFVVSRKKNVIYILYCYSNPSTVIHFGLLSELLSSFVTDDDNNQNKMTTKTTKRQPKQQNDNNQNNKTTTKTTKRQSKQKPKQNDNQNKNQNKRQPKQQNNNQNDNNNKNKISKNRSKIYKNKSLLDLCISQRCCRRFKPSEMSCCVVGETVQLNIPEGMNLQINAYLLYKIVWVFTQRRFLVRNQRFGTTCLSHLQGHEVNEEKNVRR
jgi:DNA mismatch repair ATPase MutL